MSAPILIVGAGKMGTALIRGWVKAGLGPITVVEPNPSEALKAIVGLTILPALDGVAPQGWRACVVALKPHIVRTEAVKLQSYAAGGALMISIAAGTGISLLQSHWGKASIVRAMPNTPGSIARGVTGLYAGPEVSVEDRSFAQSLLSAIGQTVWLESEGLIDAVTAVSGSGPAYIFALVEAMSKAGVAAGLPAETAALLARATVTGSGALLDADPRDCAQLIRDVATPGGTTEAALKVLRSADGLDPLLTRAIAAAKTRAEELARG